MTPIRLHRPVITATGATFAWSGDTQGLYRRDRFSIELPGADRIPERLWLLLGMMCLHMHWVLLRPCRIELPHRLLPGERERWLRLMTVAFDTLEGHRPEPATDLAVELIEGPVDLPEPVPLASSDRCAAAFSGGRDSLVQAGLLLECSTRPLLVATTSPMPPLSDQINARRREVFAAMAARTDLQFVEVTSDLRSSWDNAFATRLGYPLSVNGMTDTLLYTAAAAAAAWLEGCPHVYLAAESEVSDNARRHGRVVLFHHFMYSIPVQHALSLLLAPWGMQNSSLTSPLRGPLIQALLRRRYPDLARMQYSCWKVGPDNAACSACSKCLLMGLGILAEGGDPADVGIDIATLMRYAGTFKPKHQGREEVGPLARDRVTYEHHMDILRYLRDVRLGRFLRRRPRLLASREGWRSILAYHRARRRAKARDIEPPSGWRPNYGRFVRGPVRDQVLSIFQSMFAAAPPATYAGDLEGNTILMETLDGCAHHP